MVLSFERWKGKLAIVTGASSSTGVAIVKQLIAAGIKVVGLDNQRQSNFEKLYTDYQKRNRLFYLIETNNTVEDDVLKAFQWARENVGPVNILIHCAQVSNSSKIIDGNTKFWKSIFDNNVIGPCIATREAVKDMKTNKINGHIIYINYHAEDSLQADLNIYFASKQALTSLTESLRQELKLIENKIKVSVISPSVVIEDFKIKDNYACSEKEVLKSNQALDADDIADAVIYALSTPSHVQVSNLEIQPLEKHIISNRSAIQEST